MNNPQNLIDDVLKLRRSGMFNYDQIARTVNITHNASHSPESVRAIYRRHSNKQAGTPSYDTKRVSGWKYNVPLELEGNILGIGDTHFPFIEPGYLPFLLRTRDKYKCEHVIHAGDVVDECALSFFDKDPNGLSAHSELYKAKEAVELYAKEFPEMYVTVGNHDVRYLKLAMKSGLPAAYLKTLEEVLNVPEGWIFNYSYILNGETLLEHGAAGGPEATIKRAWDVGMNTFMGHTHNYGGVQYRNNGYKTIWGLNPGCGIDKTSYAAAYANMRKYQVTLGCAVIVDNIPHFEPYYG